MTHERFKSQYIFLIVSCLFAVFWLMPLHVSAEMRPQAGALPAELSGVRILVYSDTKISGPGVGSVAQLSNDMAKALKAALHKSGLKVVASPAKPYDVEAKMYVETDTSFGVFNKWVVFKSARLTIEIQEEVIDTVEYIAEGRAGDWLTYGKEGEDYAKTAVAELVRSLVQSPNFIRFAGELGRKGEMAARGEGAPERKITIAQAPLPEKLPLPRPDAHAVVIGINYSSRQDIPGLRYPADDAKKVYDVLTDMRYGGVPRENAVILLDDKATRNAIKSALRKIKNENGYVYVYFSGHGAPKAVEGAVADAYIIPYDADISSAEALDDTAIRVSDIEALMKESKANGVMVALDACFTGKGKSIVPAGGKPIVAFTAGLPKPEGTGKVIITSSAANEQSWEDDKELKGGIFSHYFIEGLKGRASKTEWVKVDELAGYVRQQVSNASKRLKGEDQTPQLLGQGNFEVSRNWEKVRVSDVEIARARIKAAFESGSITPEQLNKALDELKGLSRSKTLESFLDGKIDDRKFGELY